MLALSPLTEIVGGNQAEPVAISSKLDYILRDNSNTMEHQEF